MVVRDEHLTVGSGPEQSVVCRRDFECLGFYLVMKGLSCSIVVFYDLQLPSD